MDNIDGIIWLRPLDKNSKILFLQQFGRIIHGVEPNKKISEEQIPIAIDLVDAMLGLAKRKIEETYKDQNKETNNIYITRYDIDRILNIFDQNDKIERIYINFCNPWPRGKHHKKRLTHTRQLEKYKQFLVPGGKIYFKTDDDNLYFDTLSYIEQAGLQIEKTTQDLEKEENFWQDQQNYETEHEKMFKEQGIKIKAIIAVNS